MGITNAAELTAASIAMVAEARFTYEHAAVMTNLVTKIQLEKGQKSKYIPKYGSVSVDALADGQDMTESQTLAITGTTHTTSEVGGKVILTDKVAHDISEDGLVIAGKVLGNAMGKKIDKDLLALFDGFSNALGGSTTDFGQEYIAAAAANLMGRSEPAPQPYACVMHPYQLRFVVADLAYTLTSFVPVEFQAPILRNYLRGVERLYGVAVIGDGNLPIDSSNDAKGGTFSREAIIYLSTKEPSLKMQEDISLRATEIVIVADYGAVEEDDNYGEEMYFNCVAPTA